LAALKTLVGWLALLIHLLFCPLLVILGAFALASGPHLLHLEMLPWTGTKLASILLGSGLFGILSVVLAALGRLRFLFLLWSLTVAILLSKTLIFSGYRFPPGQWRSAIYLIGASWFSVLGAALLLSTQPGPGPRKYRVK
jgi:hypothetical protein